MVYATTFSSLLLAITAVALPMRGNEGVGHGVGGRLQVASTGQNYSAPQEAKLDAQLEIQDALARTQSVSSAATCADTSRPRNVQGKGNSHSGRLSCSECVTATRSRTRSQERDVSMIRAASKSCVSHTH